MPENSPVPIVFLPGVMGSRLYFPNSRKYWDPDHRGRMLEWVPIPWFRSHDYLRQQMHVREPAGVLIDHDQPAEAIDAAARDRGWGGVAWGFYGAFLKELQALAPTYAVGYDWRQGIGRLGGHLRAKVQRIRALHGAREVILITHSMGGLVARAALTQDPTLVGQVRGVLHICQPAHGAVVLYRRFFTGVDPRYDVEASLADKAFRLILGGDAIAFTGNMSGLPGPMQLVPGPHFPAGQDGPWNSLLGNDPGGTPYDQPIRPPGLDLSELAADVRADLQARVAEVRQFQQHLGGPGHPQTWAVYGIGLPTDVGIAFDPHREPVPRRTTDGDGTVPAASGAGLFGQRGEVFHPSLDLDQHRLFMVPNLSHAEACGHPTVRDVATLVINRLLGPAPPAPAPGAPAGPAFALAAPGPGLAGGLAGPRTSPSDSPSRSRTSRTAWSPRYRGSPEGSARSWTTRRCSRWRPTRATGWVTSSTTTASSRGRRSALTRIKLDGDTWPVSP